MTTLAEPATSWVDGPGFGVHVREGPRSVVVVLRGELDLSALPVLAEAVARARSLGREHLVVDLAALTFIDSSGLHALVQLHGRLRDAATELSILPGDPAVQRVFELTGLLATLPFVR
jgi:anti-sigma B factor antagonist